MQIFDFDEIWDYERPEQTAAGFEELLAGAGAVENPEYRPQLLTQLARTYSLRRQFEQAHNILDQAAELIDESTPVAQIRYLLERGRTYNSAGESDRARALFEAAWEESRSAEADFYAVDAAHMLAIVEREQAALDWNLKGLELARNSEDERARRWQGSLYNNIGWTYHERGDYQSALEMFEQALVWRRKQADPHLVRVAQWCVARCLRSLGRVSEALEMQQSLLAEAQQAGESPGYTHEELGECLLLLGREGAQRHFARAYEILSQDAWLVEQEPQRLARLKRLGESGAPAMPRHESPPLAPHDGTVNSSDD